MASLPPLEESQLAARLSRAVPGLDLPRGTPRLLHLYYEELRRWARRIDLIGPGTAHEVVERHFGESVAALPLLPAGPGRLVDLGSGAGFPGLVLALLRPDLETSLVEPREKRRAFLAAVARRCALRVDLVGARVARRALDALPSEISVLTVRALKLEPGLWSELAERVAAGGSLLAWSGERAPELPPEYVPGRQVRLSGSHSRLLREYRIEPPARRRAR